MTTKTQLQVKIQELEKELQEFKSQLNNYKEAPTLREATVGDILEDGSVVLDKTNGIAILVAPKETEIRCQWSNQFAEVFEALESRGLIPSQWFVPDKELLSLAYEVIPQHFNKELYRSSTEENNILACSVDFTNGDAFKLLKAFLQYTRAFRCALY